MPKMYQNTFGSRAPPGPAGTLAHPRPHSRNEGPTSKGGGDRKVESEEKGRRGRRRGEGRGGKGGKRRGYSLCPNRAISCLNASTLLLLLAEVYCFLLRSYALCCSYCDFLVECNVVCIVNGEKTVNSLH